MFGQKSKNQKEEEEERKKNREGGRSVGALGRKKKSKPAVGVGGLARFPGRRLVVLHSAGSLR